MSYTYIDSPVGSLLVVGDDDALHYLSFPTSQHPERTAPLTLIPSRSDASPHQSHK